MSLKLSGIASTSVLIPSNLYALMQIINYLYRIISMEEIIQDKGTQENFDIRLFWHAILENKWWIVIIAFFTLSFALFYLSLRTPQYRSHLILTLKHLEPALLIANNKVNTQNKINELEEIPIPIHLAMMRSDIILEKVIKSLNLDLSVSTSNQLLIDNNFIKQLDIPPHFVNQTLSLTIDTSGYCKLLTAKQTLVLSGFCDKTIVKGDWKISLTSPKDNFLGKFFIKKIPIRQIINDLKKQFIINNLSTGSYESTKNQAIIELTLYGKNPEIVLKILNQIAIESQRFDKYQKQKEVDEKLQFYKKQLPNVFNSLKIFEKKLNHYRATSGKIDLKLQKEYLILHLREIDKSLEKLKLEQWELLEKYTESHPYLITLKEKYAEILKKKINILNQIKQLPASDQITLNLQRQIRIQKDLYMALLNKINEYELLSSDIKSDISILSYANQVEPINVPNKKIVIIGSLVVGFILGSFFIMIRRLLDKRISDPEWAEKNLNLKNLITLPVNQLHTVTINPFNYSQKNILFFSKKYNAAALTALQMLRSILYYRFQNNHSIISLMSISKGTGKTFISANLASLLVNSNTKVLVIDADMHFAHMNEYFHTNKTPGLIEVLEKKKTIKDCIHESEIQNLFFLSSGKRDEHDTNIAFLNNQLKILIAELKNMYQYIIINTTPFTADILRMPYGLVSDINLLVIGSNKHQGYEIRNFMDQSKAMGINIDGTIFNTIKPSKLNKKLFLR